MGHSSPSQTAFGFRADDIGNIDLTSRLSQDSASSGSTIVTDENHQTLGERDKRKIQRSNQDAKRAQLRHHRLGLQSAPTTSATTVTTTASAATANATSL